MSDLLPLLNIIDYLRPADVRDEINIAVLKSLLRHEPQAPGQLQDAVGEPNATQMSRCLATLEATGMIERGVNTNDKRKFDIRLSAAGRDWIGCVQDARAEDLRKKLATLSPLTKKALIQAAVTATEVV